MLVRSSLVCCHARMCDSKGTQDYACLECRPTHKRRSAAEMACGTLRKRSTHAGFRTNVQPAAAIEPLLEQAPNNFGPLAWCLPITMTGVLLHCVGVWTVLSALDTIITSSDSKLALIYLSCSDVSRRSCRAARPTDSILFAPLIKLIYCTFAFRRPPNIPVSYHQKLKCSWVLSVWYY